MTHDLMARQRAHRRGLRAETFACLALRLKGYRILARRFRCKQGEVDIIARRGAIIAIVEVKARGALMGAVEAVSAQSWRRIEAAGDIWLARNGAAANCSVRYDIVAVRPWRWPSHICGAWHPYA